MSQINIKYERPLKGEISPPPDKSISHRASIISSLSEGKSIIRNFLNAEDPLRTCNAFRQMGIEIEEHRTQNTEHRQKADLIIHGKGLMGLKTPKDIIDCGNSGTTMRLLCGVLAGQPFSATLIGDSSLMRRPMQRVITPLTEMGAVIQSEKGGYPPLNIKGGKLKPIDYKSPVASAQVKSAVLLAGLYCDGVTSVSEPEKSRDHTERMLKAAGVNIEIKDLKVSVTGKAKLKPLDTTIPGDFSSAAFFIVAGAIVPDSKILIKNVGINPTRTGLLDILKMMGADITIGNKREVSGEPVSDISVKYSRLTGIEIGGDMIPRAIDEFPILCIAASAAQGTTKITGAKELRVKESDRIASMSKELRKMGVEVEELEDGIIIKGRARLKGATTQSYGDHRVAMSMAIAGLVADGETIVEDTECVNTSFPGFMEMLEKLQQ
ncbi:MAG: 3-phosphoshikimate 1-carboxyvinyltransferase [Thermodesulfovibrionia bacterium]|nr:3-phosphoshikimate 1-carboxyvinyltransferase [Thermodesulfovibrionia bacterium]